MKKTALLTAAIALGIAAAGASPAAAAAGLAQSVAEVGPTDVSAGRGHHRLRRAHDSRRHHARRHHGRRQRGSVSMAGLPAPLRAVAGLVLSRCGGSVISAFRPGARIRGTGRPSLHASHRAVDIRPSSYACAYRVLASWRGGMSLDGPRMAHIHLSYGGHEGRFHHGGSRRTRLARRHHAPAAEQASTFGVDRGVIR